MSALAPDLTIARQFATAFTGEENPVLAVRLLYERNSKSDPASFKIARAAHAPIELVGTLTALWPQIEEKQKAGYAAYVVINKGDGCGGKFVSDKDITTARAFFIDADGLERPHAFHLEPDFFVARDETHWHAYWVEPTEEIALFRPIQSRLAAHYQSDPTVCNPSRIMRLPGSLHLKGEQPVLMMFEENPNRMRDILGAYGVAELAMRLPQIAKAEREATKAAVNTELDAPHNIGRAKQLSADYIARGDVAMQDQGGDGRTYRFACEVLNLGLTPETALEVIAPWNAACQPPWSDEDLRVKIENASQYAQNDAGAYAVRSMRESIAPEALANLIATAPTCAVLPASAPVSFRHVLARAVPPVQEIIGGLIERQTVTFLSAPGGSHKSRLAVQWGLCIDAGVSVFGRAVERSAFHYLSYEDHADEVARRAQSIARRLSLPHDTDAQFWDLSGQDAPLAVIRESGECETKPLWDKLRSCLTADDRHKFVVIDSTYNALRFEGAAKINEGAVMAGIGLLQRLCDECNCTLLVLWHPSQAGQERGDASGWSVAWHNAPRARLSLTPVKTVEDAFDLKVEKRNHGRKGDPITLHWSDGILLPRNQTDTAAQEAGFRQAVVRIAIVAAEHGAPIQKQRRLEKWQLDEIEADIGRRPSEREVKDALAAALPANLLRYVGGSQHRTAGYYPADQQRALELANSAKHGTGKDGGHA